MFKLFAAKKSSSAQTFDEVLADFPKSEMWRLQTDGWQHELGPENYREEYYKGMNQGFAYLRENWQKPLTAKIIEDLYHQVYQFEKKYINKPEYKNGINDGETGSFEIHLSISGIENEAGISKAGIPEFVDSILNALNDVSEEGFPRWMIRVGTGEDFQYLSLQEDNPNPFRISFFNTIFFKTKAELEHYLAQQLLNASLTKLKSTDYHDAPVVVEISSLGALRENKINYINKRIAAYQAELNDIKQSGQDSAENKISAIVKFIRDLHQSHCFPDGNGRTFVFMLQTMLMFQNGLGLQIIQTPAHFAGFSTKELIQEVEAGRNKFLEFKITSLKNYLQSLKSEDILKNFAMIKNQIEKLLSKNLLIAAAQLNEVFVQIQNGEIKTPADQSIFKLKVNEAAKKNLLFYLQQLYAEKLSHLTDENKNAAPNLQGIIDTLNRHVMYHDVQVNSSKPFSKIP